jgi:hypothetical protein
LLLWAPKLQRFGDSPGLSDAGSRSWVSLFSAVEAVSGAEGGNCLLELLADVVEPICFCRVDGCADRGDQAAVGCQQGSGHDERVRKRGCAVEGESAGADLYEIGEPAYLNPDVTTHLDTAQLTDLGDDRVQIGGVRGSPPPATTKVAITGVGGWENSILLALTGPDLDAKAALVEQSVHRYVQAVDGLTAVAIDRIGQAQHDPDSQNAGTQLLRIAVQGTQEAAGRSYSSRMVELALSGYPGLYSLGPPQPGSAFGVYWPALLDQDVLEHLVHHHDGTTETIAPSTPHGAEGEVGPLTEPVRQPQPPPWAADELVVASLGEMVHARSGDKGGDANLGVWVTDRQAWEWLKSTLTIDELRRLLPEARDLEISRSELPNLGAVNFVLRGLLGTGATSTLRLDAQAKALGEWLRARSTKVPRSLVKT